MTDNWQLSYYVKSKNTADRIDTKANDSKNKQSVTSETKKTARQ